jgi:predicted ribosomally synthesized peptide with SipW-like signal peptide
MKNIFKSMSVILSLTLIITMSTNAAFTASATIQGNTFSVGSSQLRLWSDLDGGPDVQVLPNTVDFLDISPFWTDDYFAKITNTGSVPLKLSVAADEIVPHALATQINVKVYSWVDQDNDGVADLGELETTVTAENTLAGWQATPFDLSLAVNDNGNFDTDMDAGETVGLHFVFSVGDLDPSYQGASTTYDFVFNGTTTGTTP